jgi:hypothetical protein
MTTTRTTTTWRRSTTIALVLPIIAGLAACGGAHKVAAASTFNDQGNRTLTCMAHQAAAPVALDHPGSSEDPESVLTYLHYYTVNGDMAYCDGRAATTIDRRWLALYLAGGASRSHIARALASR